MFDFMHFLKSFFHWTILNSLMWYKDIWQLKKIIFFAFYMDITITITGREEPVPIFINSILPFSYEWKNIVTYSVNICKHISSKSQSKVPTDRPRKLPVVSLQHATSSLKQHCKSGGGTPPRSRHGTMQALWRGCPIPASSSDIHSVSPCKWREVKVENSLVKELQGQGDKGLLGGEMQRTNFWNGASRGLMHLSALNPRLGMPRVEFV